MLVLQHVSQLEDQLKHQPAPVPMMTSADPNAAKTREALAAMVELAKALSLVGMESAASSGCRCCRRRHWSYRDRSEALVTRPIAPGSLSVGGLGDWVIWYKIVTASEYILRPTSSFT